MGAPFSPLRQRSSRGRGSDSRSHNLGMALRCVAAGSGAISRAGIAASTGLHRSTASSLVDELISGGLVRELGVGLRQGVGRPPTTLALTTQGPAGLGIEVDGSRVTLCAVDLTGAVRYRRTVEEDELRETGKDLLGAVVHLAEEAVGTLSDGGLVVCGTGVAVTGLGDRAARRAARSAALVRTGHRLGEELRHHSPHRDVLVDHEANFAARSEDSFLRGEESYLYVSGRAGMGVGLVLRGRPYRGRQGWRCEIGHQTVDRNGPVCSCGRRGCLEQYAGQEAILRSVGIPTRGSGDQVGSRGAVPLALERAREADARVQDALRRAGAALGQVLAGCVTFLEVDRVVLGGIHRELAPWIAPEVTKAVAGRFSGGHWDPPAVEAARHGAGAAALGAARSGVHGVLCDPAAWLAR